MNSYERRKRILEQAWLGDAVLTLYVRQQILAREGRIDQDQAMHSTSNRFLARFGEPSEVEAILGRLYQEKGLQAAFAYIEEQLEPSFPKSS
ncbi:MAG: hypothetical protein OHK0021_25110 [Bryobacter sp.]|nr:hypothetical protein [Bryobacter sp.]